jgi:hypothetical protein
VARAWGWLMGRMNNLVLLLLIGVALDPDGANRIRKPSRPRRRRLR